MAQAGFIYSPLDDQDDLVICVYCDTSLSGWEKDDDPLEEHRKRAEKSATHCAFFDTGKSLGRSRSQTADVLMPTKTFDGAESEEETARTTAKTPRASRSVAKGAKTPGAGRNRSVSQAIKAEEEDDEEEEEEISAPPRRTRKASSRARVPSDEETAPRTRKASTRSRAPSADESEDITAPAPRTRKASTRAASRAPSEPRKSRAKSKPVPETEEEAEEEDDDVPDMAPVKPPRSKSRVKASSDESEPPRTRKTSTRSKGKAVQDALGATKTPKSRKQQAVESEEDEEPKKSMRASRSKPPPAPKSEDDDDELPAASTSKKPASSAKTRAKSKPPSVAEPEETLRKSTRKGKAKEDAPQPSEQRTISRSQSKLKVEDSDDELVVQPTVSKSKKPASRIKSAPSSDELKDLAPAKKSTKVKEVERKPKKKKTEKVVEDSTDGEDVFMDAVEEQAPSRPASRLTTAKPASRKLVEQQPMSRVAKAPLLDDAPIVLSSDAEEEPPNPPSKPVSNVGKLATKFEFPKKASLPEKPKTPPRPPRSPARPLSPVRAPPPPPPEPMDADVDVDMEDYIPEEDNAEIATQPVTPPRPSPPPAPAPPIPMSNTSLDMNLDAFIPALSTTPFVPLDALSEAELAMTVEEWIRFHMLLECDKFARDGEKEVLKFECKAQEVQRMLEAL